MQGEAELSSEDFSDAHPRRPKKSGSGGAKAPRKRRAADIEDTGLEVSPVPLISPSMLWLFPLARRCPPFHPVPALKCCGSGAGTCMQLSLRRKQIGGACMRGAMPLPLLTKPRSGSAADCFAGAQAAQHRRRQGRAGADDAGGGGAGGSPARGCALRAPGPSGARSSLRGRVRPRSRSAIERSCAFSACACRQRCSRPLEQAPGPSGGR